MGNMQCSAESAAHLATLARDICPFPNYSPSPHFFTMLSLNSSLHIKNHYMAVQSSLTPPQLEDFTQNLKTTFGRHGRVTYGSVGVVALSLAFLFDSIARQVKGEKESESELIPGLFIKDLGGFYSPLLHTASEYLRLVPHIANNPTRMKEDTKKYIKQLMMDHKTWERDAREKRLKDVDITSANNFFAQFLQSRLQMHLSRLMNTTVAEVVKSIKAELLPRGRSNSPRNSTETEHDAAHHSKPRQKRLSPLENSMIFHLNCDPEEASREFLAVVAKSDSRTQDALRECQSKRPVPKTWMHLIARLVYFDEINNPSLYEASQQESAILALRGDFDLKANALGKWPEP